MSEGSVTDCIRISKIRPSRTVYCRKIFFCNDGTKYTLEKYSIHFVETRKFNPLHAQYTLTAFLSNDFFFVNWIPHTEYF